MRTLTEPKKLVDNPRYQEQKHKSLAGLANAVIDVPIIDIVNDLNRLSCCFTIQSCYGHFIYNNQRDPNNIDPLPVTTEISEVEYRIAYIAFCIENNDSGSALYEALKKITFVDPENIQFCSAEWFWKRQVNSYALQVEPDRLKHEDKVTLDYEDALKIENVRNAFFARIKKLLRKRKVLNMTG